jgi:hypothetical protein
MVQQNHYKYEQNIRKAKFSFPPPVPSVYYYMTAGTIARELWWPIQGFSYVDIIPL